MAGPIDVPIRIPDLAPEADVLEQASPVTPQPEPEPAATAHQVEVPEADWIEQELPVYDDEDETDPR